MKKYYYIGIRDGHGYTFITQINRTTKTFFCNKKEKPLAFTNLSNAEDMLLSIRANGFDAILIADPKKLEERFVTPHFLSIPPIRKDDKAEFVGRIIDVFEDFLDEKNIHIPNSEREDYYSDTDEKTEEENLAIIFGSDYDYIADRIKEILGSWELIDEKN